MRFGPTQLRILQYLWGLSLAGEAPDCTEATAAKIHIGIAEGNTTSRQCTRTILTRMVGHGYLTQHGPAGARKRWYSAKVSPQEIIADALDDFIGAFGHLADPVEGAFTALTTEYENHRLSRALRIHCAFQGVPNES